MNVDYLMAIIQESFHSFQDLHINTVVQFEFTEQRLIGNTIEYLRKVEIYCIQYFSG